MPWKETNVMKEREKFVRAWQMGRYRKIMLCLDDLAQIQAETLIIVGERDPLIPLSTVVDMYDTIPQCALWVMPKATHITASNTWRAPAFAEEISRFLR